MRDYIVNIAANSRNSQMYSVIMIVSDPQVMRMMVKLNGGHKIKAICDPNMVKWSVSQMRAFVDAQLPQWPLDSRTSLANLCAPSFSPGVLWDVVKSINSVGARDFTEIDPTTMVVIEAIIAEKASHWAEFDREFMDFPFLNAAL